MYLVKILIHRFECKIFILTVAEWNCVHDIDFVAQKEKSHIRYAWLTEVYCQINFGFEGRVPVKSMVNGNRMEIIQYMFIK